MLTAGTPVVVIQSSGAIQLDCLVDPDTATKLRIGAMVEVSTSDDDKQTIPGRIDVILPSADAGSRQLRVRVVLTNPPTTLRAGGFARVTFETGRVNKAMVVPREAIKRTKQGTVAAVVDADGNVIKTVQMSKMRLGAPVWHARTVVEAEKGAFARWAINVGNKIEVRDSNNDDSESASQ